MEHGRQNLIQPGPPSWMPTGPRGGGTAVQPLAPAGSVPYGGAAHQFPGCLLVVYQCTRTHSPYPPLPTPVPESTHFERIRGIQFGGFRVQMDDGTL